MDPLLPKQVRYRAAPHSEKAMIQEHAIKVNFHVSTYTNNLRLPWHASVQYSKHITISCIFRSGANFFSDALSHFFRSLCAFRLYHHANQGFSAGGSNQNPSLLSLFSLDTFLFVHDCAGGGPGGGAGGGGGGRGRGGGRGFGG